jgi:CRP-like cAMP-binding protein
MLSSMIQMLQPRLSEGVRSRQRSDGTFGVYDPRTSAALEVSADQARLVPLIDGSRTVPEIAADHLNRHGFVPFAALRDLLRSLASAGLLANPRTELDAAGLVATKPRWMQRLGTQVLLGANLPAGPGLSLALALAMIGLAIAGQRQIAEELEPVDVLLFTAGASLALASRGVFKAAAAALFGAAPSRAYIGLSGWVVYFTVDHAVVVLLDRRPRAITYLAALLGSAVAMAAGAGRPGLWTGALAVLLIDLCPFVPTSMGRLLATLAGKVDLREHVRAYISRRFLRRVTSTRFFVGEGDLIVSALLSLAWIALIVRLLLTDGVITVLSLLALGLESDGFEKGLALLGSLVVALCIPLSLGLLVAAIFRAALSLRATAPAMAGEKTGAGVRTADFASIPFFSRLGAAELDALVKAAQEIRYRPGGPIVVQGAVGDLFFAIRSGEVAVEVEDDSGLVREVARLGPGDCFGETALLEGTERTATVRPLTETVVTALSREDFDKVRRTFGGADITGMLRSSAALAKSRFFGQLATDRLSALAMRLTPREVRAGAEVVHQGDKGDEFFLVGAGTLEVLDGSGARTAQLSAGDHFGEIALLRDVPRTATVRAVTDATLMVLAKEVFIQGIAADLKLSSSIEELAAERAEAAS